jgi:hydroxymethylglutaryl-CoA reductase (NADPH)
MLGATLTGFDSRPEELELMPRGSDQGYSREGVERNLSFVRRTTGARLQHVASSSLSPQDLRGNIENPVGAAQVPLGVAGPLRIHGQHARGIFYVPLATTEGALVRSYERGMMAISRAGGATACIYQDENRVSPVFHFSDVAAAHEFARHLPHDLAFLRKAAESTTRYGKLLRIECRPIGRRVFIQCCYHTADAHGMNMIVKATDALCSWIARHYDIGQYYLLTGLSGEKRASGSLFDGGKGKKVVAGALLSGELTRAYLHADPGELCEFWHAAVLAHAHAHVLGHNGHIANGLAALFIACGQDVANVVNAATGLVDFELTGTDDLYASVTLPSLTVGTVGGGTGLGTARECLEMLGCTGAGKSPKFAEIAAATVLAGELSMAAALASGEFSAAHEKYGRNRPEGRA